MLEMVEFVLYDDIEVLRVMLNRKKITIPFVRPKIVDY